MDRRSGWKEKNKRWNEHKRDARNGHTNMPIHRAMRKYGIENFKYEVLASFENEKEALNAEIFLIAHMRKTGDVLYNITDGGEGTSGTAAIPGGGNILPSVVTDVETQSSGVSVPGGVRVAAFIGLGSRTETLITSAQGKGNDGLDPTYTSITGSDGRHFLLSTSPLISNRTNLFKNGLPLVGLEQAPDPTSTFATKYDYRIDIATGRIELQKAALVDQGGAFFTSGATNVGQGALVSLTLLDFNAPTETWTIKCISVQRTSGNTPIGQTARFVAFGSVSGNLLDTNGNPIVWVSNGTVSSNTILSFSITETQSGGSSVSSFVEGDYFTVKVKSGALNKSDSLTATYIAEGDLNDPVFFDNTRDIRQKHGAASLDNTLALGAQLAFANSTPGIMTVQAAPSIPRRVSYELSSAVNANSTVNADFIFPLPLDVTPGEDTNVHIFTTNPLTGVETQMLPNRYPFYTLSNSSSPSLTSFINDNVSYPGGNSFSYSVIEQSATLVSGTDGYLDRTLTTLNQATFSSSSVVYDSSFVGKSLFIFDSLHPANNGTFPISAVTNGALSVSASSFSTFVNESTASFRLVNSLTGAVVAGSSGTDGVILVTSGSQATLTSAAVNFVPFSPYVNGYQLEITSSTNGNVGLYDVVAYNSGTDTLTIAKAFVSDHNLSYEVIDSDSTSAYVVLNKNVVPNGYSLRVTVVDEKDESFFDAGWENALASLESQEIDILVTLPNQTISAIFQSALTHCKAMSDSLNKKERILFCGTINGLTPDNLTGAQPAAVEDIGVLEGIQGNTVAEILSGNTEDLTNYSVADAFGNTYRCVYFGPDQIVVQVASDNQTLDGFYIAAAAAGYLCGVNDIAQPLTRKTLAGFSILRSRQYSSRVLRQLADAGVCMCEPVSGGGRVVWGITTAQSGFVEEEEISIVFIRDRIAKSFRTSFDGFIGTPDDTDTLPTLTLRAQKTLTGFIGQGLITAFQAPVVSRDAVVPTQYNVSTRVVPRRGWWRRSRQYQRSSFYDDPHQSGARCGRGSSNSTINEARTVTMVNEVGTDGSIDSAPTASAKFSGTINRIRFDRMRATEALGRDFLHVHSQRIPFDIDIYDQWSGDGANTIITTLKNVWITAIGYSYSVTDWIGY
ncbi:unnamed protein product [Sphagnum jensenii]